MKKRKTDKKNHAYILWHIFLFILHKLHRKKKRKCVCVHYVSQWSLNLTCLEFYLWRSLKGYNFHNTTCTRSITRKSQNIMCNYHIKHTAEDSLCSKSLIGCHFEYLYSETQEHFNLILFLYKCGSFFLKHFLNTKEYTFFFSPSLSMTIAYYF